MTIEVAIEQLRALSDPYDEEEAHIEADRILLSLLMGYPKGPEIVAAFEAIPKWYA
jgi:hypothetical protein